LMNGEITPEQYSQFDFQDASSFNPKLLMNKGDDILGSGNRLQGDIP
jgi:hypothetical protein